MGGPERLGQQTYEDLVTGAAEVPADPAQPLLLVGPNVTDGQLAEVLGRIPQALRDAVQIQSMSGIDLGLAGELALLRARIDQVGGGRPAAAGARERLLTQWKEIAREHLGLQTDARLPADGLPGGWQQGLAARQGNLELAVIALGAELDHAQTLNWHDLGPIQQLVLDELGHQQVPDWPGQPPDDCFYTSLLRTAPGPVLARLGPDADTIRMRGQMADHLAANLHLVLLEDIDLNFADRDGNPIGEPRIVHEMRTGDWNSNAGDAAPAVAASFFGLPIFVITNSRTDQSLFGAEHLDAGTDWVNLIRVGGATGHFVATEPIQTAPPAPAGPVASTAQVRAATEVRTNPDGSSTLWVRTGEEAADQAEQNAVAALRPPPGYTAVHIHGRGGKAYLGNQEVTAEDLLTMLIEHNLATRPVFLVMCDAAEFAQQLADLLGQRVRAANSTVWIDSTTGTAVATDLGILVGGLLMPGPETDEFADYEPNHGGTPTAVYGPTHPVGAPVTGAGPWVRRGPAPTVLDTYLSLDPLSLDPLSLDPPSLGDGAAGALLEQAVAAARGLPPAGKPAYLRLPAVHGSDPDEVVAAWLAAPGNALVAEFDPSVVRAGDQPVVLTEGLQIRHKVSDWPAPGSTVVTLGPPGGNSPSGPLSRAELRQAVEVVRSAPTVVRIRPPGEPVGPVELAALGRLAGGDGEVFLDVAHRDGTAYLGDRPIAAEDLDAVLAELGITGRPRILPSFIDAANGLPYPGEPALGRNGVPRLVGPSGTSTTGTSTTTSDTAISAVEDTGTETTGTETTDVEETGSEDTGTEDTGTEDTGTEDTGTEDTGAEDTGTEDTAARLQLDEAALRELPEVDGSFLAALPVPPGMTPVEAVAAWANGSTRGSTVNAVSTVDARAGQVLVAFAPGTARDASTVLGRPAGSTAVLPAGPVEVELTVPDWPVPGSTLVTVKPVEQAGEATWQARLRRLVPDQAAARWLAAQYARARAGLLEESWGSLEVELPHAVGAHAPPPEPLAIPLYRGWMYTTYGIPLEVARTAAVGSVVPVTEFVVASSDPGAVPADSPLELAIDGMALDLTQSRGLPPGTELLIPPGQRLQVTGVTGVEGGPVRLTLAE